MHDTYIVFGPELDSYWPGTDELHIRIRTGNKTTYGGDTSIIIDDFEPVYYGGTCGGSHTYTVGWANTQWPTSVNAVAGTTDTFYGRVWIKGLTDKTVNRSEFIMGVRAQFGVGAKGADFKDYTWYDAKVNAVENSEFGNNDEYKYTHMFKDKGEYDYAFRFSADNGKNWTYAVNKGTATISPLLRVQIPNADISQWEDDSTPTGWVAKTGTTFTQAGSESNRALTAVHASAGKAGYAFDTPEFITTEDTLIPTKLNFKLTTNDANSQISINLNCGEKPRFRQCFGNFGKMARQQGLEHGFEGRVS